MSRALIVMIAIAVVAAAGAPAVVDSYANFKGKVQDAADAAKDVQAAVDTADADGVRSYTETARIATATAEAAGAAALAGGAAGELAGHAAYAGAANIYAGAAAAYHALDAAHEAAREAYVPPPPEYQGTFLKNVLNKSAAD